MSEDERMNLSLRMKVNNPMHDRKSLEKMRTRVKEIAHRPVIRGGKAAPPTEPQLALAEAIRQRLRVAPCLEHVVKTAEVRKEVEKGIGERIATNYMIDIALPQIKLAIEVDGTKHRAFAQQHLDAKKEGVLEALGWVTLRFSNREVKENPSRCMAVIVRAASMLMAARK